MCCTCFYAHTCTCQYMWMYVGEHVETRSHGQMSSQHLHGNFHLSVTIVPGVWCPPLASTGTELTRRAHTFRQDTHTHEIINIYLQKKRISMIFQACSSSVFGHCKRRQCERGLPISFINEHFLNICLYPRKCSRHQDWCKDAWKSPFLLPL